MRSKDTCPSCGETVTPGDLLCWNCELILDPSQIPDRPSGDLSVVRRLLEVPQRGVPSARPQRATPTAAPPGGRNDGPTKVFALGREQGVPLVVASLSKKAARLSELEAFVVSFIDGESDVPTLAGKAGLGTLELGVVLQALNDKMIVDFADEPPPDEGPLLEAEVGRETLLGEDDAEVDPSPTQVPLPAAEAPARPSLRPQETAEEALARQQPTPPPPGARLPQALPPPPPTERVSVAELAAASRLGLKEGARGASSSGEQTPVEGALQAPPGLGGALEPDPSTGAPTLELQAATSDASSPTSSTDRELHEVPVSAPARRAAPTVLLSSEDIARAQQAADASGLALSEEAFTAALAAPAAEVAPEVQPPLEDTDERPARALHEADAVEPPRTTSGESIVFASSWPTVHPSFFEPPAPPKPAGVKSASFVVSPTPRSLEPVVDQPSIIVAPMTGEHRQPPPPPRAEAAPAPPAPPPSIRPVSGKLATRARRGEPDAASPAAPAVDPSVDARRQEPPRRAPPPRASEPASPDSGPGAPRRVLPTATHAAPAGNMRSDTPSESPRPAAPADGDGGDREASPEPSDAVVPARAAVEGAVPAPRPSVTPLEPADPLIPSPPSTPPELPSGPVPVAPASRPRRTLPGAGRVTASRPAPPIVLDAPGTAARGPAPSPVDALGPSGTVPEGILSPVAPRPAPLVVAPLPAPPPPAVALARAPLRPAFPEAPRVSEGRAETRPEVPTELPAPMPTAPLEAPSLADAPPPSTDPRIINRGKVNKKVLDALKQVKRREGASEPSAPREEQVETVADRLAAGSLQVALRMEQNGRLDEAIRYLEKSISQSPDAPSLYNRLAIILMRERADLRRAEQLLQKAVELAPENTVYDTNLKAVLAKRAMAKK